MFIFRIPILFLKRQERNNYTEIVLVLSKSPTKQVQSSHIGKIGEDGIIAARFQSPFSRHPTWWGQTEQIRSNRPRA